MPETIARVEEAITALGYLTKDNRRLSINQGGDTIRLTVSNFNSPFFPLLIQEVEKVARKYNCKLIVASGKYDVDLEEEALSYLLNQACRNIVMHSKAMGDDQLIRHAAKPAGLVIVNRYVPGLEEQCVWLENRKGTYLATKHLLDYGYRRICYISCEQNIDDKAESFFCCQQALQEARPEVNSGQG